MTLKQVTFVQTEFDDTAADSLRSDVKNRAKKKKKDGPKKKKTIKAAKKKKVQDFAHDLTSWWSGEKPINARSEFVTR